MIIAVIVLSGSGAAASPEAVGKPAPASVAPEKCRGARGAVSYYRALVYERQRARGGELADRTPIARGKSCHWTRYAVRVWRARAHDARLALERWRYLYDWRSWLPANWYALGSCETGYGGDPNWEHANRLYISAFGISVREYDRDAAWNGAPAWSVRHTPRDQYLAALGHLERFGDGWGCPGP